MVPPHKPSEFAPVVPTPLVNPPLPPPSSHLLPLSLQNRPKICRPVRKRFLEVGALRKCWRTFQRRAAAADLGKFAPGHFSWRSNLGRSPPWGRVRRRQPACAHESAGGRELRRQRERPLAAESLPSQRAAVGMRPGLHHARVEVLRRFPLSPFKLLSALLCGGSVSE